MEEVVEQEIKEVNPKKIEVLEMKVSDIGTGFGNPRKIKTKAKEDLAKSLEDYGDFGLILIDENNNVLAGNQRLAIMKSQDPDRKVLCKKLIGYTEAEKRAINLKDNVHAGEWDLDKLADWTADLNIDLGLELDNDDPEERSISQMELIHYEKYDYVMIVCRNELDYNNLVRTLGIEDAKVAIAKRKINARAIWYEDMKVDLIPRQNPKEE